MRLQQQLVPRHIETFLGRLVELRCDEDEEFVNVDIGQSTTHVLNYHINTDRQYNF